MTKAIPKSRRAIGVLLHPSSLPGSPVCGSFGLPSRTWLKCLARNGIGVWQFLPLAPTDSTGSPYSSPSGFALNPWFLDVQDLIKEEFLPLSVINELPGSDDTCTPTVDFSIANTRSKCVGKALRESWHTQSFERHNNFRIWCDEQVWLEDHVCFTEIRYQQEGNPWWQWPSGLASHNDDALKIWKVENAETLLEHRLLQWHLDRQWQLLKCLASELGILLFGDLPFYVSHDSADVWSNRCLFSVSAGGELKFQSGVPPDYFSETGQLWGTPVYEWELHLSNQFNWWRSRFQCEWRKIDLLRLDHFRALNSYWAIPGGKPNAIDGEWLPAPGFDLLNLLRIDLDGRLPLVAEDLGLITPEVELLRDQFDLPGMKVLQFAFDGDCGNTHLPENIKGSNWVVYTGTHDNPTLLSWWDKLDDKSKDIVKSTLDGNHESLPQQLIEVALSSQAKLVVIPIQDLLCLNDEARFNTPGTVGGNWEWRLKEFESSLEEALSNYGDRGSYWGRGLEGNDF